jgi:hypothetical protein
MWCLADIKVISVKTVVCEGEGGGGGGKRFGVNKSAIMNKSDIKISVRLQGA